MAEGKGQRKALSLDFVAPAGEATSVLRHASGRAIGFSKAQLVTTNMGYNLQELQKQNIQI